MDQSKTQRKRTSRDIIIKLIDNHEITGEEAYTLISDLCKEIYIREERKYDNPYTSPYIAPNTIWCTSNLSSDISNNRTNTNDDPCKTFLDYQETSTKDRYQWM